MRIANNKWHALQRGVVDVWSVNIERAAAGLHVYRQQLNSAERRRAERITLDHKRREFIITRGLLKQGLSAQLHLPGAEIELYTLAHGKPALHPRHQRGSDAIQFNVSHSHGESLLAMTLGDAVGVDLERIRPEVDWQGLAERFFSSAECAALRHCDEGQRRAAFFSCWTRKEAFVKASGAGIALGLQGFDVNVNPDGKPELLRLGSQHASREPAAPSWSLHPLEVADGYAAALAVHRPAVRIRQWSV